MEYTPRDSNDDTSQLEFAHSDIAEQGLRDEAKILQDEEGLSASDAMRVAAATMDGAGDDEHTTVQSMQTCRDLFGKAVKGMTTDDVPGRRSDRYAETERKRHLDAEVGVDLGAIWMTLSKIPKGGLEVANKLAEVVGEDEDQLKRFQDLLFVTAVEKKWSDSDIVSLLKRTFAEDSK